MTGFLGAVSDVGWSDDLQRMCRVGGRERFYSPLNGKGRSWWNRRLVGAFTVSSRNLRCVFLDRKVASGNASWGFLRRLPSNWPWTPEISLRWPKWHTYGVRIRKCHWNNFRLSQASSWNRIGSGNTIVNRAPAITSPPKTLQSKSFT